MRVFLPIGHDSYIECGPISFIFVGILYVVVILPAMLIGYGIRAIYYAVTDRDNYFDGEEL